MSATLETFTVIGGVHACRCRKPVGLMGFFLNNLYSKLS